MSLINKGETLCPFCGAKNIVPIWDSINTDLNPEALDKVIDGTLFMSKCNGCGKIFFVNYDTFLIYKEKRTVVICTITDKMVSKYKEELAQEKRVIADITRIVRNQFELGEKASIFKNDYDDRVIELIKQLKIVEPFTNGLTQFKGSKIRQIFFVPYKSTPEEFRFVVFTDEKGQQGCIIKCRGLYDVLLEHFEKEFDQNEVIIDGNWAKKFLEEYNIQIELCAY